MENDSSTGSTGFFDCVVVVVVVVVVAAVVIVVAVVFFEALLVWNVIFFQESPESPKNVNGKPKFPTRFRPSSDTRNGAPRLPSAD